MVMGWGAHAQNQDIRIAHIHSKTGPLEAYGKQTAIGLRMGLEYATNGTMKVAGKRLIVTESDDQGQPELGRTLLEAAYTEGKADIAIGPTASGVALAMLPVAQAHRKVLLVEPAVADAITGDRWNRYIFRTGRNSSQDAMANALALGREGVHMATLAQESAFGRDGVAAFKQAVRRASLVHEEYLPAQPGPSSDVAAAGKRLIDRLKDLPGRKVVWVLWAGGGHPVGMLEADFRAHGIEMSTGGNTLAAMVQFNRVPGMQGGTYYYYAFSRHPANLWLVTQHYLRYEEPPDMFTAGGFAAAMAVVTALERTKGDTTTEGLIRTMQGMAFETPKGTMRFRKEDHQALQSMYHFRVPPGAMPGRIPDLKLVREIKADEITVPVRNTAQR
jgi:branched-chain amino acid transport system substrate-binding protein